MPLRLPQECLRARREWSRLETRPANLPVQLSDEKAASAGIGGMLRRILSSGQVLSARRCRTGTEPQKAARASVSFKVCRQVRPCRVRAGTASKTPCRPHRRRPARTSAACQTARKPCRMEINVRRWIVDCIAIRTVFRCHLRVAGQGQVDGVYIIEQMMIFVRIGWVDSRMHSSRRCGPQPGQPVKIPDIIEKIGVLHVSPPCGERHGYL